MQVVPAAQELPHLPQSAVSVCVFTHVPEQLTVGAVQVVAHVPLLHACPMVQALPHAPQLDVLDDVLTHEPEQSVSGLVHVVAHFPPVHA